MKWELREESPWILFGHEVTTFTKVEKERHPMLAGPWPAARLGPPAQLSSPSVDGAFPCPLSFSVALQEDLQP